MILPVSLSGHTVEERGHGDTTQGVIKLALITAHHTTLAHWSPTIVTMELN